MRIRTWLLGVVLLAASWTARASLITIDPTTYTPGTDITHSIPGATLWSVTVAGGFEVGCAGCFEPAVLKDVTAQNYGFGGTFEAATWGTRGNFMVPNGGVTDFAFAAFRMDLSSPTSLTNVIFSV